MKRLVALFLIVLAVAAFATTASAKARTEWIFDNPHVQGPKAP
jgi:hypothetical protein